MDTGEALTSGMNILRRLPPSKIHQSLLGLVRLEPRLKEDLCRRVLLPFKVLFDEKASKYFIGCEYNQEDESFRSPWSNECYPNPSHNRRYSYKLSDTMREVEIHYNTIFDLYRNAYFRGGVSSVYLWELSHDRSLAAAFCIKKDIQLLEFKDCSWNSMHVVKLSRSSNEGHITVNSLVHLEMKDGSESDGTFDFACQLSRFVEKLTSFNLADNSDLNSLILEIGVIIEESENSLRKNIELVYLVKIQEVFEAMKPPAF